MHWIVRSSKWLLISQILRMGIAFWLGTWMARALGPSDYGIWSTAVAWSGLAVCLVDMGMRQVVMRTLGQRPKIASLIAGSAFRLWVILGALSVAVLTVVNAATGVPLPWVVFCAAMAPVLLYCFTVHHTYMDCQQKAYIFAQNTIIAVILSSFLRVAALLWMPTLDALVWSTVSDSLILTFLAATTGRQTPMGIIPKQWSPVIAKHLLSRGAVLVFGHAAMIMVLKQDVIMLERMQGTEAAGIYGAATRLSELFYVANPMIVTLLLPKIAHAFKHDQAKFKQFSYLGFQLNSLIACGSIVILLIGGNLAIDLLFGQAYEASAQVLMIHALACLPFFHLEWRYSLFVAMDKGSLNTKLLWLAVTLKLGLNFVLIPVYGPVGAAWATLIAYTLIGPVASFLIPESRWIAIAHGKALLSLPRLLLSPWQTWQKIQGMLNRRTR